MVKRSAMILELVPNIRCCQVMATYDIFIIMMMMVGKACHIHAAMVITQ